MLYLITYRTHAVSSPKEDTLMKNYSAEQIKNIAFLGHGNSGKSTLASSVLYYGKAVERIGNTTEGTSVFDFDAEEKKRGCSVSTSVYAWR